MSDLSDKLREADARITHTSRRIMLEAADTIDALTARVAELEGDIRYILDIFPQKIYEAGFPRSGQSTSMLLRDYETVKLPEIRNRLFAKEPTQ